MLCSHLLGFPLILTIVECLYLGIMSIYIFSVVALIDGDSEDEGTSKAKTKQKVEETAEVVGEEVSDSGEAIDGTADEEEEGAAAEEDGEGSPLGEGVDSSSERDGRQSQSACMSSRSESKPYSSVTHKCEVRNISLCAVMGGNRVT